MQARIAAAALALCLLLPAAPHSVAAEEPGLYIGGNFGWTRIDAGTSVRDLENELLAAGFASANAELDEKSTAVKILGGYQINPNLAVEAYLANLGQYDLSLRTTGPTVAGSGEVRLRGFGFDFVGLLPLTGSLSGLGRVGLFSWETKTRFSATDGATTSEDSGSDDGTELKVGIGLEWKVGPAIRLRGEIEYYNFDERVTVLSFGLIYRFK